MLNIFHLCPQIQCPRLPTYPKPLEAPLSLATGWTWLIGSTRKSRKTAKPGNVLPRIPPCQVVTGWMCPSPRGHSSCQKAASIQQLWVTGKCFLPLLLQSKEGKTLFGFPKPFFLLLNALQLLHMFLARSLTHRLKARKMNEEGGEGE